LDIQQLGVIGSIRELSVWRKKVLHLLYIFAFTILAFLAVGNLIRNMMMLGIESQRPYRSQGRFNAGSQHGQLRPSPHPELLDEQGNLVNEPFLVMRSMTVDDARERLNAIYNASPSRSDEA
jgi:hypothetical protein